MNEHVTEILNECEEKVKRKLTEEEMEIFKIAYHSAYHEGRNEGVAVAEYYR